MVKTSDHVFNYLKGMVERGKLTPRHVVNALNRKWITQEQADELNVLILEKEGE